MPIIADRYHFALRRVQMSEPILHHYPNSPFAEKVRLMLGFKGVAWRSVTIPRVLPKPDLMPLTGGYRKTPVMQFGADIFCDSACIARELERRFPGRAFFPGGHGGRLAIMGAWADSRLFLEVVGVVFGLWPALRASAIHPVEALQHG
jgi:glutathione S-transferase